MTTQRILLTGAGGQLGGALRSALAPLGDVVALGRDGLDLRDADAIRRAVRDVAPTTIVNAAAWTAVDDAEDRRDDAWAANAVAPGVLAEEAARLRATLVHYSTDYVFDGRSEVPYVEDAATNPRNVYGASKLAGEEAAIAANDRTLVLRTSWLYAPGGRNFLETMLRLARLRAGTDSPLRVVGDQRGSPTSCAFVAHATAAVLARSRDDAWGTYHLTAAGDTTWHGFAAAIFAAAAARGLPVPRLEAITSAEYPTKAARPAYSVLDSTRFARTFGVPITSWSAQLDDAMDARSQLPVAP